MKKKSRLWSLPGGGGKYVSTLQKCLEFVEECNPSEEHLKKWFFRIFPSVKSERTAKDYIGTIESLGLIIRIGNKFALTTDAKGFLETHDNNLVYQALDANYIGIHDIVRLLYEKPQTPNEICLYLRKKIGVKWQKETQCVMRLNWLRSLEYVIKDGLHYRLTKEGRKFVKSESIVEKKALTHLEIKEIIIELGNALNLYTDDEYQADGIKVDVVWRKIERGYPSEAFEVQLRGNLYAALSRLKHAWDKWNSKPFLVTTSKDKSKAERLVNGSFHEMKNAIEIVTWRELVEWFESVQAASQQTKDKMKCRGLTVYRQRGRRQKGNKK